MHHHEAATADVAGIGQNDGQREADGHGGIDGVAAGFQNVDADFTGQRLFAGHHAAFGHHGMEDIHLGVVAGGSGLGELGAANGNVGRGQPVGLLLAERAGGGEAAGAQGEGQQGGQRGGWPQAVAAVRTGAGDGGAVLAGSGGCVRGGCAQHGMVLLETCQGRGGGLAGLARWTGRMVGPQRSIGGSGAGSARKSQNLPMLQAGVGIEGALSKCFDLSVYNKGRGSGRSVSGGWMRVWRENWLKRGRRAAGSFQSVDPGGGDE